MNKNSEYEKMPKSLKGLNLTERSQHELNKLKWVVTEKIHGANFSFVYENHQLLYAKRKGYLLWTDDFFGFQLVVAKLEDNIIRLFEQLAQDLPGNRYIIYGELFGGKYPHPDVAADPQFQAIQTGVYYSPVVDFCAFDIAIESAETDTKEYLDYARSVAYFEQYGLFHAKILFSGKLNEALNFNTRINSYVPAQLQLPALDNNLIEGIVIKPLQHMGLTEMSIRPIIKIKNSEFDEEQKFHEAEKWSLVPDITSRAEKLSFLVEEMSSYVTENRLHSVLSKTGRADKANTTRMHEIKIEFLRDVYEDFNIDNAGILDDLSEAEVQWIKDRITMRIVGLLNSFS